MRLKPNTIKLIEIETSNVCNLRCPLCTREHNKNINKNYYKKEVHIDLSTLIYTLEQFPNLEKVHLVGNTSEPTLYKHILLLCKYLAERNVDVLISTNGSTNNQVFWEQLGKILTPNSEVRFCIDGHDQKQLSKYRVGANFDKIRRNFIAFKKESKCQKVLQVIQFEHNQFPTADEPIRMTELMSWGFDSPYMLPCDISDDPNFQPPWNYQLQNKVRRTTLSKLKKPEIKCFVEEQKFIYINYKGEYNSCCDRYEEQQEGSYPNIYKDTVSRGLHHINLILLNKYNDSTCISCCNIHSWKLEKDREQRD